MDDAFDAWQETHVEHTVGFIQHKMAQATEVTMALAHEIEQSTWSRDHDVTPTTQRIDLWSLTHAAEYFGDGQWQVLGISHDILLNLHHQLTRWCQDENLRSGCLRSRG